ncbi:Dam family site-specific DNA-(adenine-N6)-methyltransferase [uncultured Ruminococcus sp.]|uniref:Dam family site-specific DNA-(adenine-N6)-methyltransferase n=1 Tax=uncultured Ruminococcus sp. TaxID=165186 RepID=UPI002672AC6B|nr:Dam family site-specific DNA-(adenine-N6)-methyltransferase [uncultured Ruminococcus sp.]
MIKPVIKWSGSKRSQSSKIKSFFPTSFGTYFEPFIGGGSMLYAVSPEKSICGDICKPLIDLWKEIRDNPDQLADGYSERWNRLQEEGYTAYYNIRDDFNANKSPYDLMFLSRTCVNGLIRFNDKGEFNNSLHYSRPGINPESLRAIIKDWSEHIQGSEFFADDYIVTTNSAKSGDVVYLDPPYFHTKGRYFGTIDYERFLEYLDDLNGRGIKYLLSFDGKRGEADYTVDLPKELYKRHEFLPSGNSTFKKVIDGETEKVFESLYMNY